MAASFAGVSSPGNRWAYMEKGPAAKAVMRLVTASVTPKMGVAAPATGWRPFEMAGPANNDRLLVARLVRCVLKTL